MSAVASWVPASRGFVPIGAAVGCTNFFGPICIGRAIHNGFTLPGKVVPGKHCTLSWQGRAVMKDQYEVLCNAGEVWQKMSAGYPIPQSALPIGSTDHEGVLFAGRVKQGGTTIIGKVTSKDSKCYVFVMSAKTEIGFTDFEILTVPPASFHALVKGNSLGPQANNGQRPAPSYANSFTNNFSGYQPQMPIYPHLSQDNMQSYSQIPNNIPNYPQQIQSNLPSYLQFYNENLPNYHPQPFQNKIMPPSNDNRNLTPCPNVPKYQQSNSNNGAIKKNNNFKSSNAYGKKENQKKFENRNQKQGNYKEFEKDDNKWLEDKRMEKNQLPTRKSVPAKLNINLNELLGNPNIPSATRVQRMSHHPGDTVGENYSSKQEQGAANKSIGTKAKTLGREVIKQTSIECSHLIEIDNLSLECRDRRSACDKCDYKEGKNWECLSCRKVFCRGVDQHMMVHAVQTSHCVVISQEDLSLWCFKCEITLSAQDIIKALNSNRKKYSENERTSLGKQDSPKKVKVPISPKENPKPFGAFNTEMLPGLQKIFPWLSQASSGTGNNLEFIPVPIPVSHFMPGQPVSAVTEVFKKKPCWVKCNGRKVPPGALSGGHNHQGEVYVARIEHKETLIPGKYIPNYNRCYASFNGKEVLKTDFEVLCHVQAEWVKMTDILPDKAVQGGYYSTDLKPIYIGRFQNTDNSLILGKVEEVNGNFKLIYLLSRKEHETTDFEILTSSELVPFKNTSKECTELKNTPINAKKVSASTKQDENAAPTKHAGGLSLPSTNQDEAAAPAKPAGGLSLPINSTNQDEAAVPAKPAGALTLMPINSTNQDETAVPAKPAGGLSLPSTNQDEAAIPAKSAGGLTLMPINSTNQEEVAAPAKHAGGLSLMPIDSTNQDEADPPANPAGALSLPISSPRTTAQKDTDQIQWMQARDGLVPAGAVVGGTNHLGEVYVARAEHAGELIVGKLIPQFRTCYIAYQGKEVRKKEYQVLCEPHTEWVPMSLDDAVPNEAIPAGVSGSNTLYVGRSKTAERITIGKVDGTTKVCSALQNGREVLFNKFDILVSCVHKPGSLAKIAEKLPTHLANLTLSLRQSRPPASLQQNTEVRSTPRPSRKKDEFRLEELLPSDEDYIFVSQTMQSTIRTHVGNYGGGPFTAYNIIKIEKIRNTIVWDRYYQICKRIKRENNDELNEKKLFHGSSKCREIAKSGFDERHAKEGMFGAGVYFAEHSSKSNQYTKHSGQMLMCRVALGKVSEHTTAKKFAHSPPGHHSVKGVPSATVPRPLKYPEYIVYRGEQAFPNFLITYTTI